MSIQNDINFKTITREQRFKKIEELCHHLMRSIEKVIPVLPVSLVSRVMIEFVGEPKSLFEIKSAIDHLMAEMKASGALIYFPKQNFEKYTETALEILIIRHLVLKSDELYSANAEMIDVLTYYANSIAHWRNKR